MQQFKTILERVLGILIPLGVPVVLLLILLTSKTVAEAIVALVLILGMGFYYAKPMQLLILKLPVESDALHALVNTVARWLGEYQGFILGHLPNFGGISIFGRRLLRITIDSHFASTPWPIVVLFAGVVIRLVIGRFVRNERLQQVGREYWLFITAYTILALMVSSITHWSFLSMMLVVFIAVFILAAGLFRVGSDLISGLWRFLKVIGRSCKIAMMYIALLAARATKILRNFVRFVRELYEKYILGPFRRLYKAIQGFLDRAEANVRRWLNEEKLED